MDLYASISKESKRSMPSSEFRVLILNLYCGIRLLGFRRNVIEQITISLDQFIFLLGFYALTVLVISYVMTPLAIFDLYGLGYLGIELLIAICVGFVLTKLTHDQNDLLKFLVVIYCILPVLYLVSSAVLPNLPDALLMAGYVIFGVWMLSAYFFSALQLLRHKLKAVLVAAIWLVASYPLTNLSLSFWYEGYDYTKEMAGHLDDAPYDINQEHIYYNQYVLLNNVLHSIKPGIEGVTDLFFVGFGSDATQDVFMKEIVHLQRAMNERLGTTGRSMALINNFQTIDTIPLASSNNLRISLNHLGNKMNHDEDIVFLYLTSHGSLDHKLLVQMWPLNLNDLRPEEIKTYLDDASIRWRIILVSACYSGGFIDALQNEYSLIFTAAAADKASFGCSNQNEYTYFGEALLKNLANKPFQYIPSFIHAMDKIREREVKENLVPSEPQLFIGNLMKEKLKLLEQEMIQYAPERFGASITDNLFDATIGAH